MDKEKLLIHLVSYDSLTGRVQAVRRNFLPKKSFQFSNTAFILFQLIRIVDRKTW